jgi:hypothetical protein
MIVSSKHDFAFVHIPKCAGSTIRHPLRDKDDFGGRFYRSIEVPGLGLVNANHLPLNILRAHFPDAFEALRGVTSYTVTREPMDRFISGVAQFLRGEGREPGEIETAEILATAHGIIDYMETVEGLTDFPHTLFIRQEDYVRLDGAQVVNHVYPMERMDALFDAMELVHGLPLTRDSVWNPTVTYRFPALTEKLKATKDVAKRMLPIGAYARVRDIGIGLLTTRGVPRLNETLEEDPRVRDFIASYYGVDKDLHAGALAALG